MKQRLQAEHDRLRSVVEQTVHGHHQMAETPDETLFAIRDFLKT